MIITKTLLSKRLIAVLVFLTLSTFQTDLLAQKVTEIDTERFNIAVRKEYRQFFEDTHGVLDINDVWGVDSLFDQGATGTKSTRAFYWVRVSLLNTTPYDLKVMATGPRTVNSQLFKKNPNGSIYRGVFGSFVAQKDLKPGDSRTHTAFTLRAGVKEDIYFKVHGRAFTGSFTDALSFQQARDKDLLQNYLFFGACFILILYSLIQYLVYRKRMFLYLTLFALGNAMYAFAVRGFFVDWFMPDLPEEGLNFTLVWAQLGHLGGLLLAINFLELKQKFPKWHKVFVALVLLMIFRTSYGVYLTAVHQDYGGMTNMGLYTLLIDIVIFKVMLFALWKKVNASQKVFLIGLVLFGFALIMALITWKFNFITNFRLVLLYTASIASLSQVIIFSIALGIRMRQHEVDKNIALDKLNTTLKEQNRKIESEVIDRTKEISAQKLMLEERNERIETLFREVHHRVKNNLQLISSLLNMQQEWSSTEDPAKAIEDSRSRVVAMSMIHQFLYRTDDIATIDFKEYTEELVNKLDAIQVERVPYKLRLDFKDNPAFDIDTSISLGLILNELVTNSYKHAVLDQRDLKLDVSLKDLGEGMYSLAYQDNGEAIQQPFAEVVKKGFGLRMASRLARQLQGRLEYKYQQGNLFTITFANEEARMALSE
ncbi:MAG: hypothetical protein HEP71_30555 [Roseivirga sp.]|nr:hypothetical protein [Roseivirga sp.]